jgi:integrase
VEENNFKAILKFYWKRARTARIARSDGTDCDNPQPEWGVTTQTGAIATALMWTAKYHCKLDPDAISCLRSLASDVIPPMQSELTEKNRDRLRQFDDPIARMKLLHLSEYLMRQAEETLKKPVVANKTFVAARMARIAVAIEILLHIPLRVANLARLRLGQHLKYADTRSGRISYLRVQTHETKNHRNLEWSVGPRLDTFMQRYITAFRPILAPNGGDYLFPAGFGKNGPLSEAAMAASVKRTIADEIGAIVNPHLFRCFAAWIALENNPGALEDVRQLLGDKTLAIVLAHYSAMEPAAAARRHYDLLQKLRTQAKSVGPQSSRRPRVVKS